MKGKQIFEHALRQVGDVVFVALTQFEGEFRLAVRLLGDTLRATEIPRAATTGPTQLLLK